MSEVQVVRQLQTGDRSALAQLYSQYARAAFRTAFLITRSAAAAEDVVQDAFVQVLRNVSSLRDPGAFRPWFYQIIINTAKRSVRSSGRSVSLEAELFDLADLSALTPEEAALGQEEIQAVRVAVAGLSETHQEIIILKYYTNLSEDEIAGVLSIPAGTVKSRLYRAREALEHRLARKEGGMRA